MRSAFGVALLLTLLVALPRKTEAASLESTGRPIVSRCGRHVAEVVPGGIRLDGKLLPSNASGVEILVAPKWRRDCMAVAWVEREGSERRLIVVPSIAARAGKLSWTLPPTLGHERIFWVGRSRIAVGVAVLQPRAMASWS